MTLIEILNQLELAITHQNSHQFRTSMGLFYAFLSTALHSRHLDDSLHFNQLLFSEPNPNPELQELQEFITLMHHNHSEQRRYLDLFNIAITWYYEQNQFNSIQTPFAQKIRSLTFLIKNNILQTKDLSQMPYNLSFLSSRPEQQTLFGKSAKPGNPHFVSYSSRMNPYFWQYDCQNDHTTTSVNYLASEEKKPYKIKLHSDGLLYRAIDAGQPISDASYMYIVSPKGGLYLVNSKEQTEIQHHSSIRAGQPIFCGGYLTITAGKITTIDALSGHYHPTNKQLLMACLELNRQGILSQKCKIELLHPNHIISVKDLLHRPQYQKIRNEFHFTIHDTLASKQSSTRHPITPHIPRKRR